MIFDAHDLSFGSCRIPTATDTVLRKGYPFVSNASFSRSAIALPLGFAFSTALVEEMW